MKTITQQQLEAIVKNIFKTSIYSDTQTPIEFGIEYGNPAIFVATKNAFTSLKRIQEIIYKFAMNDIDVINIGVSTMPALHHRLKYTIELSPIFKITE